MNTKHAIKRHVLPILFIESEISVSLLLEKAIKASVALTPTRVAIIKEPSLDEDVANRNHSWLVATYNAAGALESSLQSLKKFMSKQKLL